VPTRRRVAAARALAIRPKFAAAFSNRATVLKDAGRHEDALADVDAALTLAPEQTEAVITRANVLLDLGSRQEAELNYRRALAKQPLITHSTIKRVPDFRAMFVFAPMSGNTPIDDMISFADYESNMLMLLPGADYDVAWLRDWVDVVVKLISDFDRSKQALLQAAELVHGLHKPLINAPAKVLLTDRECVSQLLASTPNCYVPLTRRYQGEAPLEMGIDLSFPLVVRVAGTHGGDEMNASEIGKHLLHSFEPAPQLTITYPTT
jgi:tetratricopeptide (TPR) repeat protein